MNQPEKHIDEIINKIHVSPRISEISENMRESIWARVNQKINASIRHKIYLQWATAAASVILLIGITDYLSYKIGYRQQNTELVQMTSPSGIKSSVTLSDGTKVFLNAGSTILYPHKFISKNREVKLTGEAYFEVAHNDEFPFIVNAENINIKVIGTKFNIKAYEEDRKIEVSLLEGCVDVSSNKIADIIRMNAGEQISYDKISNTFSHDTVGSDNYASWKEGKFYFVEMPLEKIAKQLERNFNVQISIESEELRKTVFTGDFVHGESLEQILRIMAADQRMMYKIKGNQIQIYKK